MSAGLPSRPSVLLAVAACTLSSKLHLNKAKVCVSQGCSAQDIPAGTKGLKKSSPAAARNTGRVMCARKASALKMPFLVESNAPRERCSRASKRTVIALVVHAEMPRPRYLPAARAVLPPQSQLPPATFCSPTTPAAEAAALQDHRQ